MKRKEKKKKIIDVVGKERMKSEKKAFLGLI
jgi:hypothetical protein